MDGAVKPRALPDAAVAKTRGGKHHALDYNIKKKLQKNTCAPQLLPLLCLVLWLVLFVSLGPLPNLLWTTDRETGLALFYGSNIVPFGDFQSAQYQQLFEKEMYDKYKSRN